MMIRPIVRPVWAPETEGAAAPASQENAPGESASEASADSSAAAVTSGTAEGAPSSEAGEPAAEGSAEGSSASPSQPESGEAQPKQDWRDRRIAKLTAQLAQSRQQGARPAEASPAAAPLDPTADFETRVAQAAQAQAAAMEFNRQCDAVAERGRSQYGKAEFNSSVNNIVENFVDKTDRASVANYQNFLAAALETGEAEKIIFALGSNPNDLDEAERILSLPPLKMAVELTKLAQREEAAPVTAAPRPIRPVKDIASATSTISPSDPTRQHNLSTAEWMKRREDEVKANPRRF